MDSIGLFADVVAKARGMDKPALESNALFEVAKAVDLYSGYSSAVIKNGAVKSFIKKMASELHQASMTPSRPSGKLGGLEAKAAAILAVVGNAIGVAQVVALDGMRQQLEKKLNDIVAPYVTAGKFAIKALQLAQMYKKQKHASIEEKRVSTLLSGMQRLPWTLALFRSTRCLSLTYADGVRAYRLHNSSSHDCVQVGDRRT